MGDADILLEAMAEDDDRPDTATAEGLDHAEERAQGFLRAAPDSMLREDAKELTIMPVSFDRIAVGKTYSRNELANLWGYASMHAIARGVVTPRESTTRSFCSSPARSKRAPSSTRTNSPEGRYGGRVRRTTSPRIGCSSPREREMRSTCFIGSVTTPTSCTTASSM